MQKLLHFGILDVYESFLECSPQTHVFVMWGLSNIVTHDAQTAQLVLQHDILATIIMSLQHKKMDIQRESIFTIGNLLVIV